MADAKISALTAATDLIATDLLVVVDVSDTTQAPSGTTKKLTKANLLNKGTLTADSPETVQQTWSNAGTVFTAFKVNPTNTAGSAESSLIADFQADGVSKVSLSKAGAITAAYIGNSASSDPVHCFKFEKTSALTGQLGVDSTTSSHEPQLRMNRKRTGSFVLTAGDSCGKWAFNAEISSLQAIASSNITGSYSTVDLRWYTYNASGSLAERVRFTAEGRLGIGTPAPVGLLHVNATTGNGIVLTTATDSKHLTFRLAATPNTDRWGQYLSNNDLRFYDYGGAGEVAVLTSGTGRLGIGTTNPSEKFEVVGGNIDIVSAGSVLKIEGLQVVGARYPAPIADASGGVVVDTEARDAINALLVAVRSHGLIAA